MSDDKPESAAASPPPAAPSKTAIATQAALKQLQKTPLNIAIGVQIFVLFVISFLLLKYPPTTSFGLAAVGGTAAGVIVTYWQPEPAKKPQKPVQENRTVKLWRDKFMPAKKGPPEKLSERQKRYAAAKQRSKQGVFRLLMGLGTVNLPRRTNAENGQSSSQKGDGGS